MVSPSGDLDLEAVATAPLPNGESILQLEFLDASDRRFIYYFVRRRSDGAAASGRSTLELDLMELEGRFLTAGDESWPVDLTPESVRHAAAAKERTRFQSMEVAQ